MTDIEKQNHDKKLINKEVKKFMKRLKELEPLLKAIRVTDVNLKIEEKPITVITPESIQKIITDNRSFSDKIMSL